VIDSEACRQDAGSRQVPGLADGKRHSFGAASHPGYHQRYRGDLPLYPDRNDGTARFAREATFEVAAGLDKGR
jgi:hypothetical protein